MAQGLLRIRRPDGTILEILAIRGPKGDPGVATKELIISVLGYTPADIDDIVIKVKTGDTVTITEDSTINVENTVNNSSNPVSSQAVKNEIDALVGNINALLGTI